MSQANDSGARRRLGLAAVLLSAGAGASIAAVQLRHGIVPLLDTVTYWSGAESVASGDPLRTTLAPSFSNFDAAEFLGRDGGLPFVDFPVAYPLIAGIIGLLIGTRAAMHLLAVVSVGVIAGAIVAGAVTGRVTLSKRFAVRAIGSDSMQFALLGFFALLVALLPAMRLVTQGTLSEPLFIAIVVSFVVSLARFRAGGSWTAVVVLVVIGSLLRFLGAPLALLAGWEYLHRTHRRGRALAWTAGMLLPAGANVLAASAAGGGHSAGWRGLDRLDVEVFVRSVGGWFDATQGDIRRTYFTTDGPAWWSWPLAIVALAAMAGGVIAVVRRRHSLPDCAEIALATAAILTAGLIAGILGFDALVIADNRLMLPAGVLVISAIVWTAIDRLPDTLPCRTLGIGLVIMWGLAAVRPWNALERFSDIERPLAMSAVAAELDIDIVISDDADGVHWDTGIPAAYTPMPVKPLTGETVDDAAVYRSLPCPLLRSRGAIVISSETTFSTVNRAVLDELVESRQLRMITSDRATVYLPTESACDE